MSFNSLCDAFGLDRRGRHQRLERRGGYFRDYTALITLSTLGGPQPTLCLLAAAVPLFLTGVQIERVADAEARELLRAFLDEALDVLAEHFGISERGEMRFLRETEARMVAEQESFDARIENMSKKSTRSWLRSAKPRRTRCSRSGRRLPGCAARSARSAVPKNA